MRTQETCFVGTKVRVRQEHRILERRGMIGKVVGRYGGEEYVAVDVRFRMDCVGYSGLAIWRRSPQHSLLCGALWWMVKSGARDERGLSFPGVSSTSTGRMQTQ